MIETPVYQDRREFSVRSVMMKRNWFGFRDIEWDQPVFFYPTELLELDQRRDRLPVL